MATVAHSSPALTDLPLAPDSPLEPPGSPARSADAAGAGLAEPPTSGRLARRVWDGSRAGFRILNRSLMVPLHRAGLGAWLGNPASGWQLLLTTTGRRSGLHRDTPLGYIVAEGSVWVVAGYGPSTLWYRNLVTDPTVEVLMPARPAFRAVANPTTDPATRARILPSLIRSMALPGTAIGSIPATTPDGRILEAMSWIPLVEIRPDGPALVAGPDDPGGHGWIPRQAFVTGVALIGIRALAGRLRRPRRSQRSPRP